MTGEMPSFADVEVELTRFIRRVRVTSMRRLERIDPKLDYGTFMFLVGIVDAGDDGVRASELADSLGVHKSTASRSVAALERMGLVRREPDPDDGRAQLLIAQPVAVTGIATYREDVSVRIAELLSGWEPHEISEFARGLARLNAGGDTLA